MKATSCRAGRSRWKFQNQSPATESSFTEKF